MQTNPKYFIIIISFIVHMFFVKVSGLSKFGLVDETYAGYLPIHKHAQLVLIISSYPTMFLLFIIYLSVDMLPFLMLTMAVSFSGLLKNE